jgi:hypothetical protein
MNLGMDMVMTLLSLIVLVGSLAILDLVLLNAYCINKLRHKLGLEDL